MKTINRICLAVFLAVCALLAVSCKGGGNTEKQPDAIYFEKGQLRETYVAGQALQLSGVLLSYDIDGKTETVAADAPEVTVSGYDSGKLGEQTVTVSYRGAGTTFRVTVIPRIAAEGYDTDYFVGDTFNREKGRVRVADDRAQVTTVALSDASVTVTGFDSSVPGTVEVTVTVGDYSGSISVNVLAAERVSLTAPSKKTYRSDETEFDVSGGYLTVVSTGETLTKTVALTADMVSGFNPSAATRDNAETALKQTVRISYLGKDFDFVISIRYSSVSAVLDAAKALEGVDLSRAVEETVGAGAMEAMLDYFTLSLAERAEVPADKLEVVARFASVYAYDRFVKATAAMSDVFTLNPGESKDAQGNLIENCGIFSVTGETYAGTKAALEALTDGESGFLKFGSFLHQVEKELPQLKVQDGKTADEYFETLYLNDDLDMIVNLFRHMIAIYDRLAVVPEDWTRESIKTPEQVEGIEAAYTRIAKGEFPASSYGAVYQMIEGWRTKKDALEIIHTHYLYNKTYEGEDDYSKAVWELIPFPGKLEDLYGYVSLGYSYSVELKSGILDTTDFMLAYRRAEKLMVEIRAMEGTLEYDIYNAIDFDSLIVGYLYTGSLSDGYAYVSIMGRLLYNDTVRKLLWNDYYALLDQVGDDGRLDLSAPAVTAAIDRLFADLWTVTPYERYLFLGSLYSNYRDLNVTGYVLDGNYGGKENAYTGLFIGAILNRFVGENGVIPEEMQPLFRDLLLATEQYGLRYKYLAATANATDVYVQMMKPLLDQYEMLTDADRAIFDSYAGAMLQENLALYRALTAQAPALETYPKLEELKETLEAYFSLLDAITEDGETANAQGVYALLLAAYEHAGRLSSQILSSGDADMIAAYQTYVYMVLNENDENDRNDYKLPLEAIYDEIRANARSYNVTLSEEGGSSVTYGAVAYYTDHGLADFFANCFPMLYAGYTGGTPGAADLAVLMEQYRALSADSLSVLVAFHLDIQVFHALETFYGAALAEDEANKALADAMIAAEKAYTAYRADADSAEAAEAFEAAWEIVKEKYRSVNPTSENFTAYLSESYAYLLNAATALQN